jgi:uncharacterized Ntn-hydrolase superfamily protein
VGAVVTQNRTDPRKGPRGLELLANGATAAETLEQLTADDPNIGWRQLAVVDATGDTAFFHGARITTTKNAAQGAGVCAVGNILRNDRVPVAMVEAFGADPDALLAERLMRALEAGHEAGGEWKLLKSAALLVVDAEPFALVDLRVELDRAPLVELRYLWETYKPQMDTYVARAVDPDSVPWPEP